MMFHQCLLLTNHNLSDLAHQICTVPVIFTRMTTPQKSQRQAFV
jgi:hypothetical protein